MSMTIPRRVWVSLAWLAMAGVLVAVGPVAPKNRWASDRPIPRPEIFEPGMVSTGFDDSHAVFSPDGRELYLLRNTPDFSRYTILVTRFEKGGWSPLEVAPFSGRYSDADVSFSHDGKTMFFVSTRPVGGKGPEREDMEIWTLKKTSDGWSEPEHIQALSSPGDEFFPVVADSGTLYFGSDRKGGRGRGDIWRSRRVDGRYSEPENLSDAINTPAQEFEAWVAPDESFMILAASGRPDSHGAYDLYVSRSCNGSWQPPTNLGEPINSSGWDLSPRLTPDGKYFLFTSNRSVLSARDHRFSLAELDRALSSPGNGLRDIYRMDASALPLGEPCGGAGAAASRPGGGGPSAVPGQGSASREELRNLRAKAVEAHRAKDWPALLEATRRLRELDPARPGNIYNLACAEALNGHPVAAARLLNDLLDRGVDYGIEQDADLAAARESEAFAPVLKRAAENRKPVGGSEIAFRLLEKDLLTEGIAYDPVTRAFFVGSVHRRKIVRRVAGGSTSDFVREGQDGLEAVLGLAVDGKARVLWACSAAMPQMRGYQAALEGSTALYAYDLKTGRLLRKLALPKDGKGHVLNDLTLAENGDVYATDSVGAGIYVARTGGDKLDEFVGPGVFRSPQGLAFSDDGERLYVADWIDGLFAVNVKTKKREEVAPLPGLALLGVDGLVRYRGDLVVVQNMLRPHRVVRLRLDASGARVAHASVLDQADPEFLEPTLAAVVGDDLYLVGKSQWGRFDEKTGAVDEAGLVPPAILRIPLRPAS